MANITVLAHGESSYRPLARSWAGCCVLVLTLFTSGCSLGGHHGGGGGGGAPSGPLSLPSPSSLPAACVSATVGMAYTCQISASGGTLPYAWQVTGLPNGLNWSMSTNTMTLTVSGTPTSQDLVGGRATRYTISVSVTDSANTTVPLGGQTNPPQITVNPGAGALAIANQSPLPYAYLGSVYSVTIKATGGTPSYTYALASGSTLPAGLSLSPNSQFATISGTPTTAGTFQFTISVTDSANPPASVSKTFTLTVNTTSTGCAANPGNTLCGLYWFALRGFNTSGGPTGMGGVFSVDGSGNFSGEVFSNDSVTGFAQMNISTGTFSMDPSGDGRGVVTLDSASGAIAAFRFVLGGLLQIPIEEFETSGPRLGTRAEGLLIGPETAPVTAIPGDTDLAVRLVGANGASQKAGLIGLFTIGATGCDGSSGSLKSLEPFVTNTAGTVHTGLTATGSCTAPDANGVGTAQFTISGGSPFTNNTLHFTYVAAVTGSSLQSVLFLETDAIGPNQPLFVAHARVNSYFGLSFGGLGACLFSQQGSADGTVGPGRAIASITRFIPTGTSQTGTISGVIDENAAGSLTTDATWAYTNYSVDANGVGILSGPGQSNIDVVLGGDFLTMDESPQVRTGEFFQQNSTSIVGGVLGSATGGPTTSGPADIIGVIGLSGAAAGTVTGTIDLVNGSGAFAGGSVTGSYGAPNYISADPSTGRATGNITLTYGANSNSTNVVIYAGRFVVSLILDMQSTDPDIKEAQ